MYQNLEKEEENPMDSQMFQSGQNRTSFFKVPYHLISNFKTYGFCERLKYRFDNKREIRNHTIRVIKSENRLCPPVVTSNKIDNMKYGFILFLPLFLYNQFKYFFNFFYLALCLS